MVCYADEKMTTSQKLCVESSLKCGVEKVTSYVPEVLNKWFVELNKSVFSQERGCGYWLWKPYCIATEMMKCEEGDILIYTDSGVEFIANANEIISRMDQDIFLFSNGWSHAEWSKMDILKGICPEIDWNSVEGRLYRQVQASVIFFKVNQNTRDFVKEWLLYCQMPNWIDDSPSKLPNIPTFAENRHDQSVLGTLRIKHNYKLHWWPTQYSAHLQRSENDNYPVMFNHHRKRNNEW